MGTPSGSVAGAVLNPEGKGALEYEFRLGDELRGERATLGKTLLDVQRDLRIKAAYVAAIEDMDLSVFPNPSFVPGYVRSYARYLQLDPDVVYRRFCSESGFATPRDAAPMSTGTRGSAPVPFPRARTTGPAASFQAPFPLARAAGGGLLSLPFSAIGSSVVLALLIVGLGYGAWAVLQNIQRVQFAPVEDLPQAYAEVLPLDAPDVAAVTDPVPGDLASPVTATTLSELYRRQEAEVPILVPRDGPIAALDPDRPTPTLVRAPVVGPLAEGTQPVAGDSLLETVLARVESSVTGAADPAAEAIGPVAPVAMQPIAVVAERAAWIRVYLDSGTIIFEQILEKGQTYSPPEGVGAPLIWAGNSGSVYVRVGDGLHGPLGSGTRAVRDVVLTEQAILERYPEAEVVPEVISQATDPAAAIR